MRASVAALLLAGCGAMADEVAKDDPTASIAHGQCFDIPKRPDCIKEHGSHDWSEASGWTKGTIPGAKRDCWWQRIKHCRRCFTSYTDHRIQPCDDSPADSEPWKGYEDGAIDRAERVLDRAYRAVNRCKPVVRGPGGIPVFPLPVLVMP